MIKYICDLCKMEIEGKEIKMTCDCKKIMPRIGGGISEFILHMHEECAKQLIGKDAIKERLEKCEEAKRQAEERREEREAKMKAANLMPRYTDLNAMLDDLKIRLDFLRSEYGEFDAYYCGFEEAVERIEDVPTVDAVVVRCKGCKHGKPCKTSYGSDGIYCKLLSAVMLPSDFCSYGERKDG